MNFHIHKRLIMIVAAVLVLVLIVLCAILIQKYSQVSPERVINRDRISRLTRDHVVLGPNDVQMIASWMTFDYINHVFDLPDGYLKSTVNITDPRYPRLPLMRYASENQVSPDVFTVQVQNAVKSYFALPASK